LNASIPIAAGDLETREGGKRANTPRFRGININLPALPGAIVNRFGRRSSTDETFQIDLVEAMCLGDSNLCAYPLVGRVGSIPTTKAFEDHEKILWVAGIMYTSPLRAVADRVPEVARRGCCGHPARMGRTLNVLPFP